MNNTTPCRLLPSQQGKPVCLACGTINGAEMRICVTCEKPLELKQDKENSKEDQSENRTSTPGNTVCTLKNLNISI